MLALMMKIPAGVLQPVNPSISCAEAAEVKTLEDYCLPLRLDDEVVAKLILYLPSGHSLEAEQARILNNVSSEMAVAVATAQQRQAQTAHEIDKASCEQRRHLARDLHDLLGQKLAYLRLKLDQFATDPEACQLMDVEAELKQMRLVANESCELVRGTLAVLSVGNTQSLLNLLIDHSRMVRDRTGLEITFDETGQPLVLPSDVIKEIFYIFGEALSNVERHACARKVAIKLVWSDDLVIRMTDDGQGFNAASAPSEGHYGLGIMRERAGDMGGQIDIRSAPGHGTRLTIRLPVGNDQQSLKYTPMGYQSNSAVNALNLQ